MNNYTLDISKEEWIQAFVNEWVLKWCKKNHPEVFEQAKQKLSEIYDEKTTNTID
jgi:hypothetical protein